MKTKNIILFFFVIIIVWGYIWYDKYIKIYHDDLEVYKNNMLQYFPIVTKSMDENMLKMSRKYNGYTYKGNNVYYQGQLLPEAHARTFIALEGYGVDKKSKILYKWATYISWLDIDSLYFVDELPLYIQDTYGYYFVSQQSWYIIHWNTRIDISPLQKLSNTTGELRSIENLSQYFARDDKSLYYMWYQVNDVNPNTIVPIGVSWNENSEYFLNNKKIFMGLYKIQEADVDSFEIDSYNQTLAHDKYHTYENGEILE